MRFSFIKALESKVFCGKGALVPNLMEYNDDLYAYAYTKGGKANNCFLGS